MLVRTRGFRVWLKTKLKSLSIIKFVGLRYGLGKKFSASLMIFWPLN